MKIVEATARTIEITHMYIEELIIETVKEIEELQHFNPEVDKELSKVKR
ncbi:hypothetical protein ACS127_08190 [Amphibacillus sp. Q70]